MAERQSSQGASAPEKSKLDLVKEAQAEQQEILTDKRLDLLDALVEHESIGGTDNIEESLLEFVQKAVEKFPKGIPLPFVSKVYGGAELIPAIKALTEGGELKKEGKKGKYVLKLATK